MISSDFKQKGNSCRDEEAAISFQQSDIHMFIHLSK